MRPLTNRQLWRTPLFALCIAGCVDGRVEPVGPSVARVKASESESNELHGVDAIFDSISQRVPGFGGAFFSEQTVTIALVNSDSRPAAIREVEHVLRARVKCQVASACDKLIPKDFDVIQVANAWPDLVKARGLILGDSAFASTVFLDINEQSNTVDIGAPTSKDSTRFVRSLEALQLSSQIVRVVVAEAPEPSQAVVSLLSRLRPHPWWVADWSERLHDGDRRYCGR